MKRWIPLGLLLLWPTLLLAQSAAPGANSFGITFTPPTTDLSFQYLNDMFGLVDGVLTGGDSRLLGTLFGVFNSAILVLGGIIVLYTFFIGTLRTAHEGETLGKEWSSIWIPLRTVAGISLLIPKASGYSFIQILMMWIIVQGIGVADSMWNTALNYLYSGRIIIDQASTGSNAINSSAMVTTNGTILRSLTCVEMLQAQLNNYRNYQLANNVSPLNPVPDFRGDILNAINTSTENSRPVQFPTSHYYNTDGVCGNITWDDVWMQLPTALQSAWQGDTSRTVAVNAVVTSLFPYAASIANNYLLHVSITPTTATAALPLGQMNSSGVWGGPPPNTASFLIPGTVLSGPATTYYNLMANTMMAISNASNTPDQKTAWISAAQAPGWALAGAYYFNIVKANQQVSSIVDTKIPTASAPPTDFTQVSNVTSFLGGPTSILVLQLNALINGGQNNSANDYIVSSDSMFMSALTGAQGIGGAGGQASAAASGVSTSVGGFLGGLSSSQSTDPIIGIAVYGDSLVTIAFVVMLLMMLIGFGATIGLGAIPFCSVGAAGVSIVTSITSFLTPIFMSIIVVGLTMAYYLPMIPFIIFSFGVIGWFIAVVEAILAAPLVALGISHPEGSHPILGKADPAVALMVNVFLRPTFMIFGLLFGMMVTYVGVWLVNQGFGYAFGQATATTADPFKPIAMVIIYVLIVMQILQKGFTLIYVIPDQVMRWLGMNVAQMSGEGEAERAIGEGAKSGFSEVGSATAGAVTASTDMGAAKGSMIKEGIEASAKAGEGTAKGVTEEAAADKGVGAEGAKGSEGAVDAHSDAGPAKGAAAGSAAGTKDSTGGGATPGPGGKI